LLRSASITSAEFDKWLIIFQTLLPTSSRSGGWLIDAEIAVRFTGQASATEPGDVFESSSH
jgi:hypothetical protein